MHARFENGEEDAGIELVTEFIFSSRNWGKLEIKFLSRAIRGEGNPGTIKHVRIKSIWRTVFPSYRYMAYENRLLRKVPVLLPLYWVRRWIIIHTVRRKSVLKKLQLLKNVDDTTINSHKEALLAVGQVLDWEK